MRDAILDRLIQPLVNHTGLPVQKTATALAHGFGAVAITLACFHFQSGAQTFLAAAVTTAFAMVVVRLLLMSANLGARVLSSRFGMVHMLVRITCIGAASISSITLGFGLSFGIILPEAPVVLEIANILATACIGGALYISVCEQPPAKRDRQRLVSNLQS